MCGEFSPWWPVNSPHKGPVTRKMCPFDDVIMRWTYMLPSLKSNHRVDKILTLCSLPAQMIVITTASGATNDDKVGTMTTCGFRSCNEQQMIRCQVIFYLTENRPWMARYMHTYLIFIPEWLCHLAPDWKGRYNSLFWVLFFYFVVIIFLLFEICCQLWSRQTYSSQFHSSSPRH